MRDSAQDLIERIVGGRFVPPKSAQPTVVGTKSVVIAPSLIGREDDLVRSVGISGRLAIISDPITRDCLGARIEAALGRRFAIDRVMLDDDRPHANEATVARLQAATGRADALVAVGSGTINDLAKYVAAQARKPYVVFATAPSMNGYTSVNAAITVGGLKKSLPAAAPIGVFMDLAVLVAAPPRMIRAGLGDSLCRPTAQADWLLAHLLLDRDYDDTPFALLAADEDALLAESDALLRGELAAMERLARTLVLSGFGMTLCGGSYPASQGEHLISHYIEMRGSPELPESLHGEQIGVATLTMARLQERLLGGSCPVLRPTPETRDDLIAHFGPELGRACWRELEGKALDASGVARVNERLAASWPLLRTRIAAVHRPSATLEAALRRAGAPTRAAELGWSRPFYATAVRRARQIRNRYTFLDLAADSLRLDDALRGEP